VSTYIKKILLKYPLLVMTIVLLQDIISAELSILWIFHIKQSTYNLEYELCEKQDNKHVIVMQFMLVGKSEVAWL
jgi:hypothetical protein